MFPAFEIFRRYAPSVLGSFKSIPHPGTAPFADRLRIFSLARAVVFSCAVGLVLFVLAKHSVSGRFGYSMRLSLLVLALAYGSAFAQYLSSRLRYHMNVVGLGLLVLDQALFAAIAYVTGGISSGATSLFGITCLAGGLLLGVAGAVTAALSAGIAFSLIVLATQGENAVRPPDQPEYLYELSSGQTAYYYVFNILMLLLVGLLASYLAERLQRTSGELIVAHRRADQAERMASLGRLAAGLAHEIRNPLSSISGSVQLLRSAAERDEDRELCEIVLRESKRLDELVSDMVDLSRARQPVRVPTDLGRVVGDVVQLAGRSGRGAQDVSVVRRGAESVFVSADPGQLRQLIWNLVRNAIHASAAGGEVRVQITVGGTVCLQVDDDGRGIDSEAMSRIFDVFFTTRSQGTGLGLAVVKRIADEHEFPITVTSDRGEGAQFLVDLGPPLTTQGVDSGCSEGESLAPPAYIPGGPTLRKDDPPKKSD